MAQVMADPSGENTASPDYIADEKGADECPSCVDAFVAALAETDSGNDYDVDEFGSDADSLELDSEAA